jgi:hypothetical protein
LVGIVRSRTQATELGKKVKQGKVSVACNGIVFTPLGQRKKPI